MILSGYFINMSYPPKIKPKKTLSDIEPDIQKLINEYRDELAEYEKKAIELQEKRDYLTKLGVKHIKKEEKHLLYKEYIRLNTNARYVNLNIIDFNILTIIYNVKQPLNIHEIHFLIENYLFGEDMSIRKDVKNEIATLRKSLSKLVNWKFIAREWNKMLTANNKTREMAHYKSNMHTSRLLEACNIDYERFSYQAFYQIKRTKSGLFYKDVITKTQILEKIEEMTKNKMATNFLSRK